jgi:hypothetical protein
LHFGHPPEPPSRLQRKDGPPSGFRLAPPSLPHTAVQGHRPRARPVPSPALESDPIPAFPRFAASGEGHNRLTGSEAAGCMAVRPWGKGPGRGGRKDGSVSMVRPWGKGPGQRSRPQKRFLLRTRRPAAGRPGRRSVPSAVVVMPVLITPSGPRLWACGVSIPASLLRSWRASRCLRCCGYLLTPNGVLPASALLLTRPSSAPPPASRAALVLSSLAKVAAPRRMPAAEQMVASGRYGRSSPVLAIRPAPAAASTSGAKACRQAVQGRRQAARRHSRAVVAGDCPAIPCWSAPRP